MAAPLDRLHTYSVEEQEVEEKVEEGIIKEEQHACDLQELLRQSNLKQVLPLDQHPISWHSYLSIPSHPHLTWLTASVDIHATYTINEQKSFSVSSTTSSHQITT